MQTRQRHDQYFQQQDRAPGRSRGRGRDRGRSVTPSNCSQRRLRYLMTLPGVDDAREGTTLHGKARFAPREPCLRRAVP